MIEISDVTKSYEMGGELVLALDGVDLKVEESDFLTVTGPSGSGKSTLLFTVGGLLTPTKGTVSVKDTDLYSLTRTERARFRRKNIGFIFQTFELLPYLTAVENVMLPLSLAGVDSAEQRELALEVLGRVGLTERVDHKPVELSGGEQQRVSIARGIVNRPDILLADEPTGNLDRKTGEDIMRLLRELNELDGQTIVIVTHDMSMVEEANRVVGMIDGRVVMRK